MDEIVGSYYENLPAGFRETRKQGQIYEAVIPYSGGQLRRLKVVNADGEAPWCEVEEVDLNAIRNSDAVPELNLKEREAMLVREAKCRRAVLISTPPHTWASGPHRSEVIFLLAPIYSFTREDTAEHRSRVKACAYNALFWLPGGDEHGIREGCVRLDRVQPVHTSHLDAKPVGLTTGALDALIACYGWFLTGRLNERIRLYRDEALAQLKSV